MQGILKAFSEVLPVSQQGRTEEDGMSWLDKSLATNEIEKEKESWLERMHEAGSFPSEFFCTLLFSRSLHLYVCSIQVCIPLGKETQVL